MNNSGAMKFRDLNLRCKMLLYFGTLFILIFVIIEVFNIYGIPFTDINGMYYQRQHEFLNTLNIEADVKKSYLIRFIDELKDDVSALSGNESVRADIAVIKQLLPKANLKTDELSSLLKNNNNFKSLLNELNEISEIHRLYKSIQIAEATGLLMVSTDLSEVGVNINQESWFRDVSKCHHIYHFFVIKEAETGRLLIKYVYGLTIEKEAYLLIMNMYMDDLIKPILNADVDSTYINDIELAGQDFTYIARTNNVIFHEPARIKSKILDIVFNGHEGGIVTTDYRGMDVFAAYRYLIITPELSWAMVIKHDYDEVTLPIRRYLKRRILFLSFSLVVILSIIVIITKSISRPLEAITNVAVAVGDGNYDIKFPDVTGGEINTLLKTFKTMIAKVSEKANELIEMNAGLEKKVDEEIKLRYQKEQMLVQQSKLASMGEMIAMIAHQWKQPLNAISLTVQDLQDAHEFGELNKESMALSTEAVKQQISFMAKTVDDFRTFLMPSKTPLRFNIKKAIDDIIGMFGTLYKKKSNIDIIVEAAVVGANLTITGYPNEFKQVVLNLINNARDAIVSRAESFGQVMEFKGIIKILLSESDDIICVIISDNGGGIPADIMDKVYDPYFSSKSPDAGTGLGLYMSKTIIEHNMGGRLTARNIDNGAEFTIILRRV